PMTNRSLIATIVLLAAATGANADDVADFYKGKTFTIVVGHEVGTGFDIYSRVLARHIGRHIAGHPNVVVQNMVGASGVTPANWLSTVPPKAAGVIRPSAPPAAPEPIFGNGAARFDAAKFTWIGNMDEGVSICGVSPASGIRMFEDMLTK